ncbi:MAG: hypothetical protein E5W56_01850 [Mesorhizobium sp.]|nr:MAG: hypothetical protein E5W56_01850 [Mesorhizobium sp.]
MTVVSQLVDKLSLPLDALFAFADVALCHFQEGFTAWHSSLDGKQILAFFCRDHEQPGQVIRG